MWHIKFPKACFFGSLLNLRKVCLHNILAVFYAAGILKIVSLWPKVKWTLLWVNMAKYRNWQTTSVEDSNTDSK
jgi:hypothetical protein